MANDKIFGYGNASEWIFITNDFKAGENIVFAGRNISCLWIFPTDQNVWPPSWSSLEMFSAADTSNVRVRFPQVWTCLLPSGQTTGFTSLSAFYWHRFFMSAVMFGWSCFHSASCHHCDLSYHKLLIDVRLYWKITGQSLNPYLCLVFIE